MTELLQTALEWLYRGVATIPIHYMDKRPDSRLLPKGPDGKGDWMPFQNRLPTQIELKTWFPGNLHNIGVVTGWRGLVVFDFDTWDSYVKWVSHHPVETLTVRTSRGAHVYFFSQLPIAYRKGIGIDVKSAGGYVLAPPSIHPSGQPYEVLWDVPIRKIYSAEALLPAELFPQPKQLEPVSVPAITLPMNDDPWAIADRAFNTPGQDLISKIRESASILDYVPGAEKTSSDGRWWIARCMFHDDQNPSFWIDTTRGICGCYACGGKPMDVVNLISRLQGISNQDAIFLLSKVI